MCLFLSKIAMQSFSFKHKGVFVGLFVLLAVVQNETHFKLTSTTTHHPLPAPAPKLPCAQVEDEQGFFSVLHDFFLGSGSSDAARKSQSVIIPAAPDASCQPSSSRPITAAIKSIKETRKIPL